MGDWSELPEEILHLIAQRIDNCFDLIHFRSVCSSWRSSVPPRLRHVSLPCPLPPDDGGCGDDCRISKRCVYLFKSPSGARQRFWLFKLREEENGRVILQNLFDRRYSTEYGLEYPTVSLDLLNCQVTALELEHVACYSEWFEPFECVSKVEENVGFVELGGGDSDFVVFGTLSFKRLSMYRSVDKRWTVLDPSTPRHFQATASFNGKFYGIEFRGTTTVVKPSLEVTSFQNSTSQAASTKRWLIPSGKELLLAELWMENATLGPYGDWCDPERRKKIRVEISKLDEEREDWVHGVEDLGGRVLFLAYPSSFSCLATDVPGIKGNSIFFNEFWGESLGSRDLYDRILVFDLAERSMRSVRDVAQYVELFQSPPGWVMSDQ